MIRAHGKPVIIPELGIRLHPTREAEQAGWLTALIDLVDQDLRDVVAIVYFHAPHNFADFDIDWRLSETDRRALGDRLATSPRFESGDAQRGR